MIPTWLFLVLAVANVQCAMLPNPRPYKLFNGSCAAGCCAILFARAAGLA